MKKILIGKNDQNDRFYLTVEIKDNEREATTINHQKVLGYKTLSICGEVVEYRKQNASHFGQIGDRLSEITQPSKGFMKGSVIIMSCHSLLKQIHHIKKHKNKESSY